MFSVHSIAGLFELKEVLTSKAVGANPAGLADEVEEHHGRAFVTSLERSMLVPFPFMPAEPTFSSAAYARSLCWTVHLIHLHRTDAIDVIFCRGSIL
jgi:hypothetical protein